MSDPNVFELMLSGITRRSTINGRVAGTISFSTTVSDEASFDQLSKLLTGKPQKWHVYGSFEDDVASVLRDERDRYKKLAHAYEQRIAFLERVLKDNGIPVP